MAFIPDEAIDRMTELSAGAWRLYCFLARCRNQRTGRCFPSVGVTMETIGTKRRQTFELRRELAQKKWATFDGDTVTRLFGFDSAKNRTPDVEPEGVIEESAENRTTFVDNTSEAEGSAVFRTPSAENRTKECRKSHSIVRKIALPYKEEPAKEPANRTSKERIMSSSILEVFDYWKSKLNHPQAKLTPERQKKIEARLKEQYTVEQIKTAIDGCASSPFHMGQGPDSNGTVYDDIELICRNGGKLESFIAKAARDQRLNSFTPAAQKTVTALEEWLRRGEEKDHDKLG
jgi:uncharacterized phage protein (TIGR02220 family)